MEEVVQVQDDQEQKQKQQKQHQCKLCNKSFANGKVLGGHMRSHRSRNNNIPAKKRKKNPIAAAYSLRENPKKSWKFSAPIPQTPLQENLCKICGKAFDSPKALFGHMRHHSGKQRKETIKDLGLPRRKRSTRTWCKLGSSNSSDFVQFSSSSSSAVVAGSIEPDVHELALSLLMLSNGLPQFGAESPFNGSTTHLEYCDEVEFGMPKLDDDDDDDESEMGFRENGMKPLKKCGIGDSFVDVCEEQEEGNYECDVCLKVFGSGQALGGHKRAHVLKPNLMELEEGNENGDDEEVDDDEEEEEEEFKPWWNNGDDDNGGQQLVGGLVSSN